MTHKKLISVFAELMILGVFCLKNPVIAGEITNYSINRWPISTSLSQSTITDLLVSRDGVMWVATLDGISRYDGSALFDYRRHKKSKGYIQSSYISEILEDADGRILAVSRNAGVLILDPVENRFEQTNYLRGKEKSDRLIYSAAIGRANDLWIGLNNGAVRVIDSNRETYLDFYTDSNRAILAIVPDANGNTYAATEDGHIFHINKHTQSIRKLISLTACLVPNVPISTMQIDSNNHLWIGTRGQGLRIFDLASEQCLQSEEKLKAGPFATAVTIKQILHDSKHQRTLIASDEGIYIFDSNLDYVHLNESNSGLSDDEVLCLHTERGGRYWIGTYRGLDYVTSTFFEFYGRSTDSNLGSIVGIHSSDKQGVWIATYNGAYKFLESKNRHVAAKEMYPYAVITNDKLMSIFVNDAGMWLGHRSTGLEYLSFSGASTTAYNLDSEPALTSNSISALHETLDGILLVGTYGGGLNLLSRDRKRNTVFLHGKRVIMLYESKDGVIWVGTESGLFALNLSNNHITRLDAKHVTSDEGTTPIFWSATEGDNGNLWLGTMHHGLFVWPKEAATIGDTSELIRVAATDGWNNTIYGLQLDTFGFIWASTNSGLLRVDPEDFSTTLISQYHGLQNSEFDFAVSHSDSRGTLYFGGSDGYSRFKPEGLRFEALKPKLKLTRMSPSNSPMLSTYQLDNADSLELTHKNYFVTFEFSVLDYIDPENNQFRYKLEDFDPDWIENGTRNTATYTNLSPGDYTFRVQGANSAGVWNTEGISLRISMLPPPWLSWWAYLLYALVVLILAWLGKRTYDSFVIKRLAHDMAIEMRENEERASDEIQEHVEFQDNLIDLNYRHNTRTLGIIKDFIAQQRRELLHDSADKLLERADIVLSALSALEDCLFFDEEELSADMHKYTERVFSRLIREAVVEPESVISINNATKERLSASLASNVAIFIYEAVHNSVHHAFTSSNQANYLQVSLQKTLLGEDAAAEFHLEVSDNGTGMPEHLLNEPNNPEELYTLRRLTTRVKGQLSLSANNGSQVNLRFQQFQQERKQ